MPAVNKRQQTLIQKIRSLPPDRAAEVEDFVDFLRQREADRNDVRDFARLSEPSFAKIWDNPDDAAYDEL